MSKIFENIAKVFSKRSLSSEKESDVAEENLLSSLSPELIELIFTNLDVNSLKSCLIVSKTFRDIVIHSPKCMNKLAIQLTSDNWKSVVPFIKSHGQQIKNVEFHCFNGFLMFCRLLILMPNITTLKITMTTKLCGNPKDLGDPDEVIAEELTAFLECNADKIFEKFNLTKLENLELSFFKFDPTAIVNELLCCKNIRKFYFRCFAKDQFDHKVLNLFLSQQNNLKHLELEVAQIENIFIPNSLNFELRTLKIITTHDRDCDYTCLSQFLSKQSNCLEELRTFPKKFENRILGEILKLKNLKKLTTHGLLPCFRLADGQEHENTPKLCNLTYYRFSQKYKNEIFDEFDFTSLPNLKTLNLQFGSNFIIVGTDPLAKVTENPLRNLMNLKEFHIESRNQNLLEFLASPTLESLVIPYDSVLDDIETSIKMIKNLPNLQHLTIVDIKYKKIFKFFIENHKNLIKVMRNNNHGLKTLELHFSSNDVLKLTIVNGEVDRAVGIYSFTDDFLYENQKLLRKTFKNFDLTMITDDEYNEMNEHLHFY